MLALSPYRLFTYRLFTFRLFTHRLFTYRLFRPSHYLPLSHPIPGTAHTPERSWS